jgi:protein phosphatase
MGDQKHSSVITNCIGGGCTSSYIDVVHIVDIQDGDTYLLCSDGLTDMMSDNRLSILLAEGADANDLCNAAIVRGGFDNVSACLIKVKKE